MICAAVSIENFERNHLPTGGSSVKYTKPAVSIATHEDPAQQEITTNGDALSTVAGVHSLSGGAVAYTTPPDTATHRVIVGHETPELGVPGTATSAGLLHVASISICSSGRL